MGCSKGERIVKLENELIELRYEVAVIKKILSLKKTSPLTKAALDNAYKSGLMPSPYGESIDLCRILLLMDSLGLLTQKVE